MRVSCARFRYYRWRRDLVEQTENFGRLLLSWQAPDIGRNPQQDVIPGKTAVLEPPKPLSEGGARMALDQVAAHRISRESL